MLFKESKWKELLKYKFNGEDRSFLYYHCGLTYWDKVLSLIPLWVAPNVITLTGFIAMAIQTGVVLFVDPNLKGCNRWVSFASACAMWFYSTMDCIDGMQARRTGAKSPLGQLFDHGVDSVVCTFIILCVASAIGVQKKKTVIYMLTAAQTIFYWITSKEYYTHLFYLGFIGPTEIIAMTCLFLLGIGFIPGSKVPSPIAIIKKNLNKIIQSGCILIWLVSTIGYIIEIGHTTGFGMSKSASFLGKVLKIFPHFLFVATQILAILTVSLYSAIERNQIFYSYLALYTAHFSLTSTLVIFSHQIGSTIVIPLLLILFVCQANMSIIFSNPYRKIHPASVTSAIGVCYYIAYISNIISGYLFTLNIPFFFNNYKGG